MNIRELPWTDVHQFSWKRILWRIIKVVALVLILSFVMRNFFFTNYIVNGQSMMPTIHDGERIIVNKIGYEVKQPDRFDLIIFAATEESDYIKRVIGLPGDKIFYEDDSLYINGMKHDERFLDAYKNLESNEIFTENFTLKNMTGKTTVPEGNVFVLGDNRQNSVDSRHIGFVPLEKIIGRANVAFWPIADARLF